MEEERGRKGGERGEGGNVEGRLGEERGRKGGGGGGGGGCGRKKGEERRRERGGHVGRRGRKGGGGGEEMWEEEGGRKGGGSGREGKEGEEGRKGGERGDSHPAHHFLASQELCHHLSPHVHLAVNKLPAQSFNQQISQLSNNPLTNHTSLDLSTCQQTNPQPTNHNQWIG